MARPRRPACRAGAPPGRRVGDPLRRLERPFGLVHRARVRPDGPGAAPALAGPVARREPRRPDPARDLPPVRPRPALPPPRRRGRPDLAVADAPGLAEEGVSG